MNVVCNTQKLAAELRLLNRITPAKPAIPVLAYILFRAEDQLYLSATDLELMITTTCQATIQEMGMAVLPAKKLQEIVDQLPDGDINVRIDKGQAFVTAGAFKSRLQVLSYKDFPKPPIVEGIVETMNASVFHAMIDRVAYAISDKTQKFVIDGALLSFAGAAMAMVSTDGQRLSVVTASRAEGPDSSAILPSKILDVLSAQDSSGNVEFSTNGRHLFFVQGRRTITSRMLEGEFPKYHRIIPKQNTRQIVVNRMALAATLRRVGLVNEAVNIAIEPGSVHITASSAEVGDADESVAAQYDGDPFRVCVNWKFLLDFLEHAAEPMVTIMAKDETSALLLKDGPSFINVLMVRRS